MRKKADSLVAIPRIEPLIVTVRGERVILDAEIAALYGVPTKVLLQAVKRNRERFPPDFMIQLTRGEVGELQAAAGAAWGGRRYLPYAFTEHGAAMLASVLRSDRATQVNIEIVRAFVRLRRLVAARDDLVRRLDELEQRYDRRFKAVFDVLRGLMAGPGAEDRQIGFG